MVIPKYTVHSLSNPHLSEDIWWIEHPKTCIKKCRYSTYPARRGIFLTLSQPVPSISSLLAVDQTRSNIYIFSQNYLEAWATCVVKLRIQDEVPSHISPVSHVRVRLGEIPRNANANKQNRTRCICCEFEPPVASSFLIGYRIQKGAGALLWWQHW